MVNLQSHDTFRMSTVYFESDEKLFSQDLNSTDDPEYRPPRYFRTGRHSSFINFAIFHLKCAGFDLGSSPEMEEGCEMLNFESFEKHVSQSTKATLKLQEMGLKVTKRPAVWRCLEKISSPFLNRASLTSN